MKVEIRSSGGKECRECGSTELLHTTSGVALNADLAVAVENAFDRLERELVELWEEEKVSIGEVVEQEKRDLADRINREHAEFEERVAALLGERAPWFRLFRRRWQTQLEREFKARVDDLRVKTTKT